MRFLRDAVITVLVICVAAIGLAFAVARGGGLAADKEPGRVERTLAGRLVRLSIPSEADRQQNPFANDEGAWREAREHYADHCAVCHGRDGKGDSEVGKNMYPKVPDLTGSEVQQRSDGALFYIIQNGIRWTGMPAWKTEHSSDETWKLVAFIRKAPSLTEADLRTEEAVATTGETAPARKRETHPHRHRQ
jgi:mono/diheme cytochrome c family protein